MPFNGSFFVFMFLGMIFGILVQLPNKIDPFVPEPLPELPSLEGVLEPNTILASAEKLWENIAVGPEAMTRDDKGMKITGSIEIIIEIVLAIA
jgi:hypothetical protein